MRVVNNKTIEKLKYDLVREGYLTVEQLSSAQELSKKNSTNLATELLENNFISEQMLLKFLEQKLHIPYVELNDYTLDSASLKCISKDDALKYKIIPLFKIEDVLTIAMSDPLNLFIINNMVANLGLKIEPVVCSESSILETIEKYYSVKNKKITWRNIGTTDNLTDSTIKNCVLDVLSDAINNEISHIIIEHSPENLNIIFDNKNEGSIPLLLAPRFLFELKLLAGLKNKMQNNTSSEFCFKNHNIILSSLITGKGERISLNIVPRLKEIKSFNVNEKILSTISVSHGFIGISSESDDFVISLLNFIANKNTLLTVEHTIKCRIEKAVQIETFNNVGLNLDTILNQVDFQKIDAIFFEKIYSDEDIQKLKKIANDKLILFLQPKQHLIEDVYGNIVFKDNKTTIEFN